MYPIIGDRYKCKDCVEVIGFDLCGDCYNSRSKLPGRFNQQHKPEHKFEFIGPFTNHNYLLSLMTGIISSSGYAPSSSSPGPIPPADGPEGSELYLTVPFELDATVEDDLSETEGIWNCDLGFPGEPEKAYRWIFYSRSAKLAVRCKLTRLISWLYSYLRIVWEILVVSAKAWWEVYDMISEWIPFLCGSLAIWQSDGLVCFRSSRLWHDRLDAILCSYYAR